ncbi:MAG: copper transporter [bacterium]
MGPIDIRYHAISIAAVFLALGVGIIVGSSTNFFGITSILDRQNRVIERLEGNYKDIRKDVRDTRAELTASKQYIGSLETGLIPQLLSGRLDGFRYGVVTIGVLPGENASEDSLVAPLKSAGAVNAFKLRVKPEKLSELAGEDAGAFVNQFGKELLRGAAFGSKYTDAFMKDGSVASGSFEKPVDGVIFALGENVDLKMLRDILLPIEKLVLGNKGISLNVVYGKQAAYEEIFKPSGILYFSDAETLPGQIEVVRRLEETHKQNQGQK